MKTEIMKYNPETDRLYNSGSCSIPTVTKTTMRKRYGTKPFDLSTLQAARKALRSLETKELVSYSYIDNGEYCCLGAFAVQEGIDTKNDPFFCDRDVRGYLIEAKNHDPRTVDALETVNQGLLVTSAKDRYKQVMAWIAEEIKRSKEAVAAQKAKLGAKKRT